MTPVTPSSTERIIQWSAGPIAILAGWLATQITQHFAIFGSLDLGQGKTGQSQLAHALVAGITFLVGAGVTYAAHHKVLDNIQKRWESKNVQSIATLAAPLSDGILVTGELGSTEVDPDAILKEIDTVDAKLETLLAHPGTPAATVVAGLAPDPPVSA